MLFHGECRSFNFWFWLWESTSSGGALVAVAKAKPKARTKAKAKCKAGAKRRTFEDEFAVPHQQQQCCQEDFVAIIAKKMGLMRAKPLINKILTMNRELMTELLACKGAIVLKGFGQIAITRSGRLADERKPFPQYAQNGPLVVQFTAQRELRELAKRIPRLGTKAHKFSTLRRLPQEPSSNVDPTAAAAVVASQSGTPRGFSHPIDSLEGCISSADRRSKRRRTIFCPDEPPSPYWPLCASDISDID